MGTHVLVLIYVKSPMSFDDFTDENEELLETLLEYEDDNQLRLSYIMGTRIDCNFLTRDNPLAKDRKPAQT
jgi:hypothetical protein